MSVEAARVNVNVTAEGAQQANKELDTFDSKISGLSDTLTKFAAVGGIALATKAVFDFAMASTTAFAEAESAATRLNSTAELRGLDGGAERLTTLANAMQNLTGTSGEVVQNLAAQLIAQGKSEAMTKKLIKAAADLSAVTGDDLATSVGKLNLTLGGMAKELGRTNPEIAKMTKEQLMAGGAVDVISTKYAGFADRMRDTLEVSSKLRDETAGDMSEAFGSVLAPALKTANNALIGLYQYVIQAVGVFNQLPGPIKFIAGALVIMTGAVVALAVAQQFGITTMVRDIAIKTIDIVKTIAGTIAKWAQVAAQTALNLAVAVGAPLMLAGIVAATAATIAIVAYTAAQSSGAVAVEKTTEKVKTSIPWWKKTADALQGAKNAYDALRAVEQEYAAVIGEVQKARTGADKLRQAGILSEVEAINQKLEAEKKGLAATIERAKNEKDPKLLAEATNAYRVSIELLEGKLKAMSDAEELAQKTMETAAKARKDVADQQAKQISNGVNSYNELLTALEDEARRVTLSAEEYRKLVAVKERMADVSLVEAMGLTGPEADAALLKIQTLRAEIQAAADDAGGVGVKLAKGLEDASSVVGSFFSSLSSIASNVSDQQVMNAEAEAEAEATNFDQRIANAEEQGASVESIQALKDQAAAVDKKNQTDLDALKKKTAHDQAVRDKTLATFQAAINIPLLIIEGLKTSVATGVIYGILGAVQLAAVASQPVPAAQFGGSFTVPPGYAGDSGAVRVNQGEKVTVEPVRNSGIGNSQKVVLQVGEKEMGAWVQQYANSGRLTITRPGVVRA